MNCMARSNATVDLGASRRWMWSGMIGHDHEFVELKDPALTIAEHCIQQQPCGWFGLEQGSASPGHRSKRKICDQESCPQGLKAAPGLRLFSHGWKPCASTALPRSILGVTGMQRCDVDHTRERRIPKMVNAKRCTSSNVKDLTSLNSTPRSACVAPPVRPHISYPSRKPPRSILSPSANRVCARTLAPG
jgi:hypothetical protein